MKKFKLFVWLVIAFFLALFIFSNKKFFFAGTDLSLDLVYKQYHLGTFPNWLLFVCWFVLGMIIGYLFSVPHRLRAKREIKNLNATVDSHLEKISTLKTKLDSTAGDAETSATGNGGDTPAAPDQS